MDIISAKSLHEVTQDILQGFTLMSFMFFDTVEKIAYIRDSKKYKEAYSTFDEYIDNELHSVGKRSTIYKYLMIYEKYNDAYVQIISENPTASIPLCIERLYIARNVVKSKEDAVNVIQWSILNTPQGFQDNIRELENKTPSDKCMCDGDMVIFEKCQKCGKVYKRSDHEV